MDNTIFEKLLNRWKFIVGPTKLNPGPTLDKQVRTAENDVITSNPLIEIIKVPTASVSKYKNIKFKGIEINK